MGLSVLYHLREDCSLKVSLETRDWLQNGNEELYCVIDVKDSVFDGISLFTDDIEKLRSLKAGLEAVISEWEAKLTDDLTPNFDDDVAVEYVS